MSLITSTSELLISIENEKELDVTKGEDVSALIYATASMLRAYIDGVASQTEQDATEVKKQAAEMFQTVLSTGSAY